ncbi:unnamed protein product [Brachionus calyciflorus]|uniref:Uncharacterized protein n=1 Tax=Brachionus calyciflorus TaxID=104777 RepID=A0A814C1N3_9BILA|nr:unnamed protein product [Brachionus calyciflorus]
MSQNTLVYPTKEFGRQEAPSAAHLNNSFAVGCIVERVLKQIGEEDDVEEWFNKFDRVATANGWSDFEKGRKVPVWFKEKPLNILSEMHEDAKYSYSAVKENIITK